MSEVDPAAVVEKWMLTLADKIADQAEAMSGEFKNETGDVALREFAKAIRRTNERAGFIPASMKQ